MSCMIIKRKASQTALILRGWQQSSLMLPPLFIFIYLSNLLSVMGAGAAMGGQNSVFTEHHFGGPVGYCMLLRLLGI